jgi:phosphoglucosamine mutase
MRRGGYVLGGEQSGHLINLAHGPSGDGVAAALHLLGALRRRGEDLATAGAVMQRLPQRLVNVRAARKAELAGAEAVWEAVRACERELGEDGRVVVRPSGTEPLVRVMVEAPTVEDCDRWCQTIVQIVERELGGPLP